MTTEILQNILRVKKLVPNATIPTRATDSAAGYDLYASESGCIPPFGRSAVSTGIALELPTMMFPSLPQIKVYGSIRPRSGLSIRHGINTGAGVVDSDYRGEIKVVLFNHTYTPFYYKEGDRVAQLVLETHITPAVKEVTDVSETVRGDNGFGSTGR